jgi:hypothetical protein
VLLLSSILYVVLSLFVAWHFANLGPLLLARKLQTQIHLISPMGKAAFA